MKEKGSALILFILSLLIASGGIVGSSLVIKKYYPSLIPNLANNDTSKSSQDIQSSDKSPVATPTQFPKPSAKGNNKNPVAVPTSSPQSSEKVGGDPKAIEMVNKIRNVFTCHFSKFGKYPSDMSATDEDCLSKNFDPNDKNSQGYSIDNYVAPNNGLSYSVELTAPGKGYTITDKGSNYIELPQAEVNASMLRMRDATRVTDLSNLKQAIDVVKIEAASPTETTLCSGGQVPCFGDSRTGSRSTDGTGWIKVKLSSQRSVGMSAIPVDPVNNDRFHYVYCSDGKDWEINVLLESDITSINKMKSDGGDDDTKYEVGSNLNLINKVPGCRY